MYSVSLFSNYLVPAGNHMFKVNDKSTRTRCEICSKLTIKTTERRHWRHSGVFIVNFEHISHLVLVFLFLTLSKQMPAVENCDMAQKQFERGCRM